MALSHPNNSNSIRLRGVRQNNLKGFDLDIPLGKLVVVTGLSGAGKSSLVFDTLHAEGQRRYVETFSAYTRQFLELLRKPKVDSIENVRPSIAIEQTNTVKTSRSTVGTMTELCDYFKVWFAHTAGCFDPETGEAVEDDNPSTLWKKVLRSLRSQTVLVTFPVARPENLPWADIRSGLDAQGYRRCLLESAEGVLEVRRIEDLGDKGPPAGGRMRAVQDRLEVVPAKRSRFLEAAETALHFGRGRIDLFSESPAGPVAAGSFSTGLHSPSTGRTFRPASPGLFSFNSPIGACPTCRGFGRVIDIDYRLAIPDARLSIDEGAIRPWEGQVYGESKVDCIKFCRKKKIPVNVPFRDLSPDQQKYIIDGDPGYGENGVEWPRAWYGLKGFFRYLEARTYKMHVRVFLSRFRAYNPCPVCHGTRLQPEALCWKWKGRVLPDLYRMPVSDLLELLRPEAETIAKRSKVSAHQAELALHGILTRLRYLDEVGLGYLTLDRSSRSLSGGEVQRVYLTSCLGTSLVDTLFVLDEPSVGLHARDIARLIRILRGLTDAGNTVVVVEHDESVIRSADHLIEIGPEPGGRGGHLVYNGAADGIMRCRESITGAYLSGRMEYLRPEFRRPVTKQTSRLRIRRANKHNIRNLDLEIPLGRFVCLSGVSGSGKSTLLDNVVYQGWLRNEGRMAEDPAVLEELKSDIPLADAVLVDQSPISRTPRSNPALFSEAWDLIRRAFAETEEARRAGMTPSSFSFNAGDGRCDHCQGLGYERVEMQFLSDVFVPCPSCEGRRFKPEVLAIRRWDRSVAELLDTPVSDALKIFADDPGILRRLQPLADVGLGYLNLGQPLNTLSGGEAQRLKLVRYLGNLTAGGSPAAGCLLLLDEPTTGLHRHDVQRLVGVLNRLVDHGQSVVVIEHNLDVLQSSDWIIELGPEAGAGGGRLVAAGTPETLARSRAPTAPFLQRALRGDHWIGLKAAEAPGPYVPGNGNRHVLRVTGAREHNLKNLNVDIPHHELTVVTGVSGSGKSTLAFDILFAEGQRRFMESMSPYARQFVEQLPRPDIDALTGIPPTVAIEQRVTRGSRKSTVATITEVAQYLRLLYARIGIQHHPATGRPVAPLRPAQLPSLLHRLLRTPAARRAKHLYLCAPLVRGRKGHHQPLADWIAKHGYSLMRVDGRLLPVDSFTKLDRYREHDIEVVVANFKNAAIRRDAEKHLNRALELGKGACFLLTPSGKTVGWLSTTRTDLESGESFPELDPKHFSFNSPRGWCPACRGHGRIYEWMLNDDDDLPPEIADLARDVDPEEAADGVLCPECKGERLNRVSRAVKLPLRRGERLSLPALLRLPPADLLRRLRDLKVDSRTRLIATDILPEIETRLRFLDEVGLSYLTLERPTVTLSGGEAQRIRLAAQLGSNLCGVLYILDEPTIGLHARDNDRLIQTLGRLRSNGNTVLVVEHDDALMERADRIIDLGPGAGVHGGNLLANDTPARLKKLPASLTGLYLEKGLPHPLTGQYRSLPPPPSGRTRRSAGQPAWMTLEGVRHRNLAGFDLWIPLGRLTVVCGPSGSGKSTLLRDLLRPAVACAIRRGKTRLEGNRFVKSSGFETADPMGAPVKKPPFAVLENAHRFRSIIEVDQSPIGKTPRSTPATYLGAFDLIRGFFASLPESKIRGYNPGRFSFNTPGGRCETCQGAGRIKLEMNFLPDAYLPCDDCGGSRYGPELADLRWKDLNIGDVLRLTFEEAAAFFEFDIRLKEICNLMVETGLGYLTLGQSSPTLSGGEAQRLKLVTELARGLQTRTERARGARPRNLYILEEPTIGLHLSDCEKLIHLLHRLVDQGHTVMVIEHHLDIIAEADYVVELGPEGGPKGGRLLHQGTVAQLAKKKRSVTAPYVRTKLNGGTAKSA